MDIEKIKDFVNDEKIRFTEHFLKRIHQRKIRLNDILLVLTEGVIIEEYPDDYPYPSCLMLGFTVNKKNLHIVCGLSETDVWLITAYYPDSEKWSSDFKIRKG